MLRLVVRRAWVQRRLLTAVVLLVVVATTLLGFCSQLLSVTEPRALSEQVQRSQPHEVDATAYVLGLPAPAWEDARQAGRDVVGQALAPLHPSLVSTATSRMRRFGSDGLAYLGTTDALAHQVTLTSGRWPADGGGGPVEALVPAAAARVLHLRLGQRLTLGAETGADASHRAVRVVVVGTFRATSQAAWASDPLAGAGFSPSHSDGLLTAPTYGPFMVGDAAFSGTGSAVDRLRVDAHPDLRHVDDAALSEAATSLGSAYGLLADRVGTSAGSKRVASELPETLSRLHAQQDTTRAAVLVVLLLGTTLALAALVLASGLVADTRVDEREVLTVWGLGRGQELVLAVAEAVLLAAAAAVVAVPAAAVAHALVTHLSSFESAGLAQGPVVTAGLVLTASVGAVVLALVFVLAPMLRWEPVRIPGRRGLAVRLGIDALLLVIAVVGWWTLHSRPDAATGSDTLLILAPVLCLAATTLLAVRCLPALYAVAAAAASRSRALVPLSLHSAAHRLRAGVALSLLAAACAAAVFGVSMHATWQRSQDDQADLQVGTGLSLTLAAPATTDDAASVVRAATTPDGDVSPVTARPVALGSYVSGTAEPPEIVAIDARQAGALVRGRLDGSTWSAVGRRLAPRATVPGVPLPDHGAGATVVATAPDGADITVTPSLVLEDADGFRSTLVAAEVPADGRERPLRWAGVPAAGQRVIAAHLTYSGSAIGASSNNVDDGSEAPVSVVLRLPGHGDVDTAWDSRPVGEESPVTTQSVSVRAAAGAIVLETKAQLRLSYLPYVDGEVLVTDFAAPAAVPVAVSQELVDALGAKVGDELSATVSQSTVLLDVVAVVPSVPSAPGQVAVLADVDSLSRALIGTDYLGSVVDAFWVSSPTTATTRAVRALDLGDVTSRDEVASELARGPMQVTVPAAYVTLAVAAVLLLLAGAALVVSADERTRTAEVARLRALGLTRRGARLLLLTEHSALLVPLAVTGLLVGSAVAVAVDTSQVRSVQGTAPVPGAALAWPWATELLLGGGLVLGCLVIAAVAALSQVHRSDITRLRTDEWR